MNDPIEILKHDHCVPIEKYTLILKHEYVDKDGKPHLIDQPFMVSSVAYSQNGMVVPVNVVIRNLTEKMAHEVIRIYGGEE